MEGDAKRRFCSECQHHVHNLSAMSERERADFVAQAQGRVCIAYVLRPDGTMVITTWWTRLAMPFRRVGYAIMAVLSTLLPFVFGGCASRGSAGNTPVAGGIRAPSHEEMVKGRMKAPVAEVEEAGVSGAP